MKHGELYKAGVRGALTAARKLQATGRLQMALDAIAMSQHLNAFIEVFRDEALRHAAELDERPSNTASGLAACCFAVKDNISMRGKACTAASEMLRDYVAPYDATVIARLRTADAIILGRSNMDEFAMGSSGESSVYGAAIHPFLPELTPGGSSSGSAVAVAAGLADAALGSDTGGSIRQPAAFTATVGLKPTWGRVSRYGLLSFAPSLEQIGPITKTVFDAAAIMEVIAGIDPLDVTTADIDVPCYTAVCSNTVTGMRVGVPADCKGDAHFGVQPVHEAARLLKEAGAKISNVTLPHQEYMLPVYFVIANVEAAGNLARYDGMRFGASCCDTVYEIAVTRSRGERFGSEVRRRLLQGAWIHGDGAQDEHYQRALRMRGVIHTAWLRLFDDIDVLIMPVTGEAPFRRGARTSDAMAMRRSDEWTVAANVTGLPAISLPVSESDHGLPRAVQLLAGPFKEELLFTAAAMLEVILHDSKGKHERH